MLADDGVLTAGDGAAGEPPAIAVPPTIQALLAARLDRLEPDRASGRRGGVGRGKGVHARARGGAGGRRLAAIDRRAAARARAQGPHPARRGRTRTRSASATSSSATPPTRGCRRSCAPSCTSASRDWLEARPSAFPAIMDELLGYHLERAVRLRRELGETDDGHGAARLARRRRTSARPACGPPSATTRRRRARCSSARWRSSAATTPARGALLPALGGVAVRGGAPGRGDGVLDEAIDRAPEAAAGARARGSSASSCASRRRPASGPSARGAWPTRPSRCSSARATSPGSAARGICAPQAAWIAGRGGRRRRGMVRGRRCVRAQAGDERELFRILGMRATAAVLGPTPVDDADPPLRGVPRARRREPGGGGADGQPARLAARDAGRVRARRRASCSEANETLDQLGSLGWVSHHEALVRLLEGRPGAGRASRCASAVERLASMGDGELLATTLAMLAQAVYAQGQLEEAEQLCRDGGERRRGRRHRDPGDLARRRRRRSWPARGRAEEAEALARDGGAARRADRLALPSRRCDARPRRGTSNELPHR